MLKKVFCSLSSARVVSDCRTVGEYGCKFLAAFTVYFMKINLALKQTMPLGGNTYISGLMQSASC